MNEKHTKTKVDVALQILRSTDMHLFLTGKAGTGKTTFLLNLEKKLSKRMVVLAPTGIAAINAHGMTIHSFFQLPFTPYIPGYEFKKEQNYKIGKNKLKLINSIDLLVIDEISMVRADLLDAVDTELRRIRKNERPFGGIQLLMIGDLQQLPPVVNDTTWAILRQYYETPYFFSSKVLTKASFLTVELDKVYRQSDDYFLSILNKIRDGKNDAETLSEINCRYIPNFRPAREEGYIQLMTHNEQVTTINNECLDDLPGEKSHFGAVIKGKFPESSFPTEQNLILKIGAQIMFVKNDVNKRFFNGMIGMIVDILEDKILVSPKGKHSTVIEVVPEEWTNVKYALDKETHEIVEVLEGTFTQYPVKLAWAITVHKSQGLTFDKVIIDVSSSFSHGQTYVALSRCKTLEGIVLSNPIPASAIISDNVIKKFTEEALQRTLNESKLSDLQKSYHLRILTDVFSFEKERIGLSSLHHFFEVNLYNVYPETVSIYAKLLRKFDLHVILVAHRFHKQCEILISKNHSLEISDYLQERINKGSTYFIDYLAEIEEILGCTNVELDNAVLQKRFSAMYNEMKMEVSMHKQLLEHVIQEGFDVYDFQKYKMDLMIKTVYEAEEKSVDKKNKKNNSKDKKFSSVPVDVKNPELYNRLLIWRKQLIQETGEKAFRVMPTTVVISIANLMPLNEDELLRIPRISKNFVENQGRNLIMIVNNYLDELQSGHILQKKEEKPRKEKTHEHSLRLYLAGKTPREIAEERGLVESTIYSHLEKYLESGEVLFKDLVSDEHFILIKDYLEHHPRTEETTLTDLRKAIGEELISFNDLRLSLKVLELEKNE